MDQKSSDYEPQELEKFGSSSKLSYEAFEPSEERSADKQNKCGTTTECQTQKSDASINQPINAPLPSQPQCENKVSSENKEAVFESPALLILPIMLPVTAGVATGTPVNPEILLQNQGVSAVPATPASLPAQAMIVPVAKSEQIPDQIARIAMTMEIMNAQNQAGLTEAAVQAQPTPYPSLVAERRSPQVPAIKNAPPSVEAPAILEEQRKPIQCAATPTEQSNVQNVIAQQSCTPPLQTSQPQMIVATPSPQPAHDVAAGSKVLAKMAPKPPKTSVTQATTPANVASKPVVNISSTPQQMQASHKAEARRVAQKCVSNPILTPVTDEMPTEDRGGDWVAPETMEEKQQKGTAVEEKQQKTKAAPQAHKATIPVQPVALPQKKSDIQAKGKVKQAQKGSKKCLSNPILTPTSDEFPTDNWDGEWIAPKEIIAGKSLPVKVRRDAKPEKVDRALSLSNTAQVIKTPEVKHKLELTEKPLTPPPEKGKLNQVWRGVKTIGPPENIGNIVAKCVSDPIVTPVTDEFPSENTEGQWIAPDFIKATNQRLLVQRTDYAESISNKRIISDPIVTPCTDEYPSEEDKYEFQNDKIEEKPAKFEKTVNTQRSHASVGDATSKDNRELTERWMKDQMGLIRSLSGSVTQPNIFLHKEDQTSRNDEKADSKVTATDKTENCNVSPPSTPFGSNEFAASREHILRRKEKTCAKRSKGHENQRASAGKRDKKKNVFGTVAKFIKSFSKRSRNKRSSGEN